MGATEVIGIFLPPPFRKSSKLCGLDIFTSVRYHPFNGSSPFPNRASHPFPAPVLPIVVWMGGLPTLDVRCQHMTKCTVFDSVPE